ncbi:MAG TPA: hypothetical protein VE442_04025 [Jatrophihabitans sp.]|jgi:hypothetical protein|nr:hypothetical protein [Jatrophihabitans sp.]
MQRKLYWAGVVAGVLMLAAGAVVAVAGIASEAGPASVVRSYFAALSDGDAARALAYGTVPPGRHPLLTADVLREQQRIAPLGDVAVVGTDQHGASAHVRVKYALAFPGQDETVSVQLKLHKSDGDWRLDKTAVPIDLLPTGGRQRESILGARLPDRTELMFPGAFPIRLDTPYLKLDPAKDTVTFDLPGSTGVYLEVSDAGAAAMRRAVRAALGRCLTHADDPACPLPTERYVPGSIQGVVKGGLRATSVLVETLEPVGTLRLSGSAKIAGTWQRLDFHNQRVTRHGHLDLDLHAVAYAKPPLRVRWVAGS